MIGTGFQIGFVAMSAFDSTCFKNTRTLWMAFMSLIAPVGAIMMRQIDPDLIWARSMGYCLIFAFSANFPLTMAMVISNTFGFTKKNDDNCSSMSFTGSFEVQAN